MIRRDQKSQIALDLKVNGNEDMDPESVDRSFKKN